ncbi:Tetratricopeptide repeat protein [Sulfidibacter corallicola]|uniref:Tetratricopeptide repeat protein n=1 Tax=Sulfidibacter corallicola TaxID=2818388 RepID=A0A8A4TH22_SULCO|nr:tetratricopeptide repeat protein [Sulfidibacter corallicola]QTD48933.1 tetratricopeptide repeat protein [Sulfidibacter corallicola]
MAAQKDPLEAYISRLIDLRSSHTRELNQEEMRRIALDLGLTEKDLEQAEKTARDHLTRARTYLIHRRYGDAIDELNLAAPLLPESVEVFLDLAQAHAALNHRQEAERYARHCLSLDPSHAGAVEILNQLDGAHPGSAMGTVSHPRLLAGGLGLFLVLGGVMLFLLLVPGGQKPAHFPVPGFESPETSTPHTEQPKDGPAEPAEPTETDPAHHGKREIPLNLHGADHLALTQVRSRLSVYSEKAYYKVRGLVRNEDDTDLTQLTGRLELIDKDRLTLKTQSVTLFREMAGTRVHPGEAVPFGHTLEATPDLAEVRLVVEVADREPSARLHKPTPVELTWTTLKPEYAELEVWQRSYSEHPGSDRETIQLSLDIVNAGKGPFSLLRLDIVFTDAEGSVLNRRSLYAVPSSHPPLQPGEKRAVHTVVSLAGNATGYRVEVVQTK